MTRLIDANDFFERLCDRDCDIVPQYSEDGYSTERIEETLDAPTVDAVQVVRCRDCEFWYGGKKFAPNFNACRMWSASGTTRYTADMDFCSKGERKTTAEEAEYDELRYSWARDEYESPIY
jgi:hypothetical protein